MRAAVERCGRLIAESSYANDHLKLHAPSALSKINLCFMTFSLGAEATMPAQFVLRFDKGADDRDGPVPFALDQLTKIATYGSLGVLTVRSVIKGVSAGFGAMVANLVTRRWLDTFKEIWFRRLAILLMFIWLWPSREILFKPVSNRVCIKRTNKSTAEIHLY
jgi:hypothetical protein